MIERVTRPRSSSAIVDLHLAEAEVRRAGRGEVRARVGRRSLDDVRRVWTTGGRRCAARRSVRRLRRVAVARLPRSRRRSRARGGPSVGAGGGKTRWGGADSRRCRTRLRCSEGGCRRRRFDRCGRGQRIGHTHAERTHEAIGGPERRGRACRQHGVPVRLDLRHRVRRRRCAGLAGGATSPGMPACVAGGASRVIGDGMWAGRWRLAPPRAVRVARRVAAAAAAPRLSRASRRRRPAATATCSNGSMKRRPGSPAGCASARRTRRSKWSMVSLARAALRLRARPGDGACSAPATGSRAATIRTSAPAGRPRPAAGRVRSAAAAARRTGCRSARPPR